MIYIEQRYYMREGLYDGGLHGGGLI